jgi:hypothetical protein
MLIDVPIPNVPDPILAIMSGGDPTPKRIAQGIYECRHWNFADCIGLTEHEHRWPNLEEYNCYGVCDSIEQFNDAPIGRFVRDSPRRFVVSFVRIVKSTQPAEGGWRWHKWGPYIGKHESKCEYLYDEEDIDEVWTYSVHEVP